MEQHNIDLVIHAFQDTADYLKLYQYYEYPIQSNSFIPLQYNVGVSTTNIINELNLKPGSNVKHSTVPQIDDIPSQFVEKVVSILGIKPSDSILEMGCGAGAVAKEFDRFISPENYIGVEASRRLVHKHLEYVDHSVLNFNSTDTIFKANYFDFSVCNGMFEYLNSIEELNQVVHELERVSRKAVYYGSIRFGVADQNTNNPKCDDKYHNLLVPKQYFIDRGYTIGESNYDKTGQYDALKILK
jgi:SAM-dependent methyltransferase